MAAPSRESRLEKSVEPRPVSIRDDYIESAKLKGKVALISGADSGIGRAVALAFAKEGAKVSIAYLDEHEDVDELMQILESEGKGTAIKIAGDLSDEKFAQEAVKKTMEAVRDAATAPHAFTSRDDASSFVTHLTALDAFHSLGSSTSW